MPERGQHQKTWLRVSPASIWGAVLIGLVVTATLGPLLTTAPDQQALEASLSAPSWEHLLGTDLKGRDLLSRTTRGLGLSLGIGLAAASLATVLGIGVGAVAGYVGGRVDSWIMRAIDVLYGLPYIVFVVVLVVTYGRGMVNLFLAIGVTSWLTTARIVRAEVRTTRARAYVEAARSLGAGHVRILWRHVLPNVMGPVIVYAALTVPMAVRQEALLSFLGLGVEPPAASLGALLREGLVALSPLQSSWWLLLWPALVLLILVAALHGLSDALRDRFDPRSR